EMVVIRDAMSRAYTLGCVEFHCFPRRGRRWRPRRAVSPGSTCLAWTSLPTGAPLRNPLRKPPMANPSKLAPELILIGIAGLGVVGLLGAVLLGSGESTESPSGPPVLERRVVHIDGVAQDVSERIHA